VKIAPTHHKFLIGLMCKGSGKESPVFGASGFVRQKDGKTVRPDTLTA
jgi:hypothetical protein